jgi:hypothetical protein
MTNWGDYKMKQRQKISKGKQNTEVRIENIAVVLTCRNIDRTWRTKKLTCLSVIGKGRTGE